MLRPVLASVAFLTRAPFPSSWMFTAQEVARGALFFPLVGAGLGCVSAGLALVYPALPPWVLAFVILAVGALATGALHWDGLADMADGFGGGRDRDDVLRIMKDHLIGAYGAVALAIAIGLQASLIAELVLRRDALALIAAAALCRWPSVPLARAMPYARTGGGKGSFLGEHVGTLEVAGSTVIAAALAVALLGPLRGAAALGAVVLGAGLMASFCQKKIGGITGDTLGATTIVCETLVLLVAVAEP